MTLEALTEDEIREDIASMQESVRLYRVELRRRLETRGAFPEDAETVVRIRNGAVFRRSTWGMDRWDAFGEGLTFKTSHVADLAEQHGFDVLWPMTASVSSEVSS